MKNSVRSACVRSIVGVVAAEVVVGVAEEEHGLRVELVGEEELVEEVLALGVDRGKVEGAASRSTSRYWRDQAHEGADVELLGRAQLA